MEINKEREAFEKLPMIREKLCWHIWFSGIDNKYDSYLDKVEEDRNFLNGAWMMFQAKATPEGFVLVPKVITDEWMAVYVEPEVSKYCKEFEGLPFAVTEKDLPMIQEDFRRPIKAAHSRLMKVIEAQEQSHD